MRRYIRNYVEGGTFFFTLVTYHRNVIFNNFSNIEICLNAIKRTQKFHSFELVAYCIMPDHLHLLVSLPDGQIDYSTTIKEFKKRVTKEIRRQCNRPDLVVWQDRFHEHTIRNQHDLKIHFDYIHYNPIKHGYVVNLDDWKWSSFEYYFGGDNRENAVIDPNSFPKDRNYFGE